MSEFVESEPEAAEALFGATIDRARAFAHNLADQGERRGLIGPRELPRLWSRHILNSALLAPLLKGTVADVGSGAGLPGLVLAIARPDVTLVLIEPMERRVVWLQEQVGNLGLANVQIEHARAEDVVLAVDQVTARAVSALKKLLPLTAPLVRVGGELLLMKGSGVSDELENARKEIRKFDVRDVEITVLGGESGVEPTRVLRGTVHRPVRLSR